MDTRNQMVPVLEKTGEQLERALGRIFAAAQPGAVFSEPVVNGGYTVINASQGLSAGGFGSGMGYGQAPGPNQPAADESSPAQSGGGGGMGGGGFASGRPVAAIVIGPDGVRIKPIVDVTRLGIAGITAWAAILVTLIRLRRAMGK